MSAEETVSASVSAETSPYTESLPSTPAFSLVSPASPASPISPSSPLKRSLSPSTFGMNVCNIDKCMLCGKGVPSALLCNPTWATIMRVVFYCLEQERPQPFFHLKSDVYPYIVAHWSLLCVDKKRTSNWHKQIQDMLSHSKNVFESGSDVFRQSGFWRSRVSMDPWGSDKWTDLKPSSRSSSGGSTPERCSPVPFLSSSCETDNNGSPRESKRRRIEREQCEGLDKELSLVREMHNEMVAAAKELRGELDRHTLSNGIARADLLRQLDDFKEVIHHTKMDVENSIERQPVIQKLHQVPQVDDSAHDYIPSIQALLSLCHGTPSYPQHSYPRSSDYNFTHNYERDRLHLRPLAIANLVEA